MKQRMHARIGDALKLLLRDLLPCARLKWGWAERINAYDLSVYGSEKLSTTVESVGDGD